MGTITVNYLWRLFQCRSHYLSHLYTIPWPFLWVRMSSKGTNQQHWSLQGKIKWVGVGSTIQKELMSGMLLWLLSWITPLSVSHKSCWNKCEGSYLAILIRTQQGCGYRKQEENLSSLSSEESLLIDHPLIPRGQLASVPADCRQLWSDNWIGMYPT